MLYKMPDPTMLSILKALSDATRLRLVGLLSDHAYTVEQLAALLDLGAPTISHHLSRLAKAGLVSAEADGYYSVYSLDANNFEAFARRLLDPKTLSSFANGIDLEAYDRRVLAGYVREDGTLREIPAQRRKRMVILRHVLQTFQAERRYSETQVNEILARFHADTETLLRDLVGLGWLKREGASYRRVMESARLRDQSTTWSVW